LSAIPAPAPVAPAASLVSLRTWVETISHWFLQPAVLIRVVVYLTALIYLRTVLFDYVYDDNYLIILNPWMESWKYVTTIFSHSFWSFTDAVRSVDFYRPLVMLTLVSIRHLLGPAPGWFHLVAAGIHVLATYLTYRLAVETTGDRTLAAISAGFFGLHPTKVETAAWISGISDSLCVIFFLGSMISYFHWKNRCQSELRRKYLWVSLSLLLLALFSKEAAIFAPVLIGAYEFASGKDSLRHRCFTTLRSVWPFAAVTGFLVVIRLLIIRIPTGHITNDIPLLATIFTVPQTVVWYLSKQVWPVGLSVQYPAMVNSNCSFTRVVLPACGLLAFAVVVFSAVRKSATGIFFTLWFLLMLAPVLLFQVRLQQHDRYFYLPSVATSIGFAYLITRLRRLGDVFQGCVVVVVFAALSLLSIIYSSYWDDDQRLFTRAVQIAPHNSNACRYLAGIYINEQEPEKAEALGRNLLNDPESRGVGWYILGTVRLSEKDYEAARSAMQKAVESSPGHNLLASVALADVDMLLDRNEEAIQLYRDQLHEYPQMAYIQKRLAAAIENRDKLQQH
jgi:hypothetical protein